MKFRVTCITGTEEGREVSGLTVELEEALNLELSQRNFGSNLDMVAIFVVTAFDEIEENRKWAEARNKLGQVTNEFTGVRSRCLSFGVPVERAVVLNRARSAFRSQLVQSINGTICNRPRRIAAGLDFEALSEAMRRTLSRARQHAN